MVDVYWSRITIAVTSLFSSTVGVVNKQEMEQTVTQGVMPHNTKWPMVTSKNKISMNVNNFPTNTSNTIWWERKEGKTKANSK